MPPKKKLPATNINFIISLEVYPFDVMVSINQTDEQMGVSLDASGYPLSEKEINLVRYASETALGRYGMFENNASFIRIRKLPETPEEFGTLAHEIFHAVTIVMDRIGAKLKIGSSDEPYAYLIGYLTQNIYERINKYY